MSVSLTFEAATNRCRLEAENEMNCRMNDKDQKGRPKKTNNIKEKSLENVCTLCCYEFGWSDVWYFGWIVGLLVVDCFVIFLVGWLVVRLVGG